MKIVLSLSGGLDSSTLLGTLVEKNEIQCVSFRYGSKHNEYEIAAAEEVAAYYQEPLKIIDMTAAFAGFNSALMRDNDQAIPEGHYESETMKATVVPGRNMIFTSVLAGLAESLGFSTVALGIHSGDHAIYPDCRPAFLFNMDKTVIQVTSGKVGIIAPFLMVDKSEIIRRGLEKKVPYHLTRTCYKDQELSCGVCGSCVERLEAFGKNLVFDPIKYAK